MKRANNAKTSAGIHQKNASTTARMSGTRIKGVPSLAKCKNAYLEFGKYRVVINKKRGVSRNLTAPRLQNNRAWSTPKLKGESMSCEDSVSALSYHFVHLILDHQL